MARLRRSLSRPAFRLWLWLGFLALGAVPLAISAGPFQGTGDDDGPPPLVLSLKVDGPIGPGVTNYLDKAFEVAVEEGAELIVLEINTPGGLLESTRDIIHRIISSPVPVATYVSPTGSRAASAGTYILYASHVAAMAPGTTMGAATPVQTGGGGPTPPSREPGSGPADEDPSEDDDRPVGLAEKVMEDAAAYMRSLAELRGRNAEWGEKAVREAATVTDREAVEEGIVDLRAGSVAELVEAVDGWTVVMGEGGEERTLATAGAEIRERLPDWVDEFLSLITNPNVAFIFMMLGVYGLFFELANPGALVPGVLGAVSLLIGLYALNVLPINHAGLALLLLGIALLVAEAFAPSFGILGGGGLVAFALGALMLFDIDDPAFQLSGWTVGTVTVMSGLVLSLLVGYLVRAQSRPVASGGPNALVGKVGDVKEWSEDGGMVMVDGEWWNARGPVGLAPGDRVRVEGVEGLRLTVVAAETSPRLEEPRS